MSCGTTTGTSTIYELPASKPFSGFESLSPNFASIRRILAAAVLACVVACAGPAGFAQTGAIMIAIDKMAPGAAPADFEFARTGQGGPGQWAVAADASAAAGLAIEQTSTLSLDQQSKISEIITNQTPQPLTGVNFSVAPDVVVPPDVTIQRLPAEAEKLAPQLLGYSYLAVEELVAIVDTNSRKISSVMQRMRRQENTKSDQ